MRCLQSPRAISKKTIAFREKEEEWENGRKGGVRKQMKPACNGPSLGTLLVMKNLHRTKREFLRIELMPLCPTFQ